MGPADAVRIPVDGELDLHAFRPEEVREVVEAYLEACIERSILSVRIVHGKGTGSLRRTVHALLKRHPGVVSYKPADTPDGGWGATWVHLAPPG